MSATITGHGSKGHDMLDEYNEEAVADERLLAVVNLVANWLFKPQTPPSQGRARHTRRLWQARRSFRQDSRRLA